eukprot:g163.t1
MTDPLGPIGVRPPLDPLSSPKKVPKPDGATTVDPERPPRSVEALERSQRREVVWGMIIYGFARYFVTTSIQMGTLMLLEVSYGLSAELSGAIFTVMCLSSFAVSGLASAVISRQVIDESALFLACNAVALSGLTASLTHLMTHLLSWTLRTLLSNPPLQLSSPQDPLQVIFFFDFGTGAFGLLFATTVVYSCASLSNGIAEGWASRAAQEGTDFSNEAYRTLSMSLSYLASFMASVVARAFLDLGGRNLYAALQLVMVTLSTIIVYKVVSMTWDLSHEVTQNGKESGKEVSFTLTTWLAVGFVYVVFLVHELYANRVQPVLVSHRGNSLRFQSALLFRWFSNFLNDAMLLPITLDFATSMGQTASMSGFFISCSLFASVLGVVMGQWIVNESAWDQQRARALILWSPVLYTVVLLLEAALSNGAAQLSVSSKQVVFWVMILLSQVAAFAPSLAYVPLMVMWGKFTPKKEMSFWSVLTQCDVWTLGTTGTKIQ